MTGLIRVSEVLPDSSPNFFFFALVRAGIREDERLFYFILNFLSALSKISCLLTNTHTHTHTHTTPPLGQDVEIGIFLFLFFASHFSTPYFPDNLYFFTK